MARRKAKRAVWRAQKRRQRRRTSSAVRAAARRLRERAEGRLVEATALVRALRRVNPSFRFPKRQSWELFEDDHGASRLRGRGRRRSGDRRGPFFRRGMAGMSFEIGRAVKKNNPLDWATLVTGAVTGAGAFAATKALEAAWKKRRKRRVPARRCVGRRPA